MGWHYSERNRSRGEATFSGVAYAFKGTVYIERPTGVLEIRSGGTASWRTYNPGNLVYGPFAVRHGALGFYHDVVDPKNPAGTHDLAIFPDYSAGRSAFSSLIAHNYGDDTIAQLFQHYADPRIDNVPAYVHDVSSQLGVSGDTLVKDLTPDQLDSLADAVQAHEIWREGTVTYGTWTPIVQ